MTAAPFAKARIARIHAEGTVPPQIVIASFDPSSSAMGYAKHLSNVVPTIEPELLDAGLIEPERDRDPANERIEQMVRAAMEWVREARPAPELLVIEDTSGKVARRGRGRGMNGAGLAVYGKAVGWLIGVARLTGIEVITYLENDWTRGGLGARAQSKGERMLKCAALHHPRYKIDDDPGGDCGDAIMLGRHHCFMRLYEK